MKPKEVESWMVPIPKGNIGLRDDRKKEKWIVDVRGFLLSKFLVTQELYLSMMSENPSAFVGNRKPVETVSWYEAIRFCNALSDVSGLDECYLIDRNSEIVEFVAAAKGYRLPTDAEWEYACRAGTKAVQYGPINEIAWYEENSGATTHDVGLKAENGFGLFDMLGNVWEWCWDVYDPAVYGSYRIFRGGGWCDSDRGCLASNRRRSHPTYKIDDLGFRVARSV